MYYGLRKFIQFIFSCYKKKSSIEKLKDENKELKAENERLKAKKKCFAKKTTIKINYVMIHEFKKQSRVPCKSNLSRTGLTNVSILK